MEYQCHLLTCIKDLQCQQISEFQERLTSFTTNLNEIRQQLIMINARLKHAVEFSNHALLGQNLQKILDELAFELRCGICSELMVFATTLNCMHTFCQYCIAQWKNESPTAGCPVCREPTISEKRNFLVDNMVEIMVSLSSEDEKFNRKELLKQQEVLHKNLVASALRTPESNNPFYRVTDRGLVLSETQIEELPIYSEASEPLPLPPLVTRNSVQNTRQSRERPHNRRRNHYTRLLVNIGRRRMLSRNSQHSMPPCSPENGRTTIVGTASPINEPSPRFGETALALTLLYLGVTLFLYYTLHYLQVL